MVARYQGRWGVLQGSAIRKARTFVAKAPDSDAGSATSMREYGSIEISKDDWLQIVYLPTFDSYTGQDS